MTRTTIVRPPDPTLRPALALSAAFAFFTAALHVLTILWARHLGYGYFRDEFYYLACGHHLAWGYVDHGPVVAVQARLAEIIFGRSVLGIRMFSLLAESVGIFAAGILAWSLGGSRPAQALAMLGLVVAPVYLGMGDYLSMNSFEPVFWTVCLIALVIVLRGRSALAAWLVFGVSAGLGLLNKPSMTFFLLAVGAGLLLTPYRRILFTRHAAMGVALLLLIASPNILWQVRNHWPTLEFLHNGKVEHKNTILSPPAFFLAQMGMMNPLTALLWIPGLVALLRGRSLPNLRWLGYACVFFFVGMYALHAKDYYLAPMYPALFAAGAIAWDRRQARKRAVIHGAVFAFPMLETLLGVSGVILLPMASPVLRPDTWVTYTHTLHLIPGNTENAQTSALPQFFADRFGWDDYTTQVVHLFQSLSAADQRNVCIFAENYGEAGALAFLGPTMERNFPRVISRHNSYWMWGMRGCDGDLIITMSNDSAEQMLQHYESVTVAGHMTNRLSMPYEHKILYLLRNRRKSAPIEWEKMKEYT